MSNPPNIGEPTRNANATATPNTIPTMINRLFMMKIEVGRDKNELKYWEEIWNKS